GVLSCNQSIAETQSIEWGFVMLTRIRLQACLRRPRHPLVVLIVVAALLVQGPQAVFACRPISNEILVYFAGEPNLGGVSGGIQVTQGSFVQLHGVSELRSVAGDCTVTSTPVAFSWQLRLVPRGGSAADVTTDLAGASTLDPSFFATQR